MISYHDFFCMCIFNKLQLKINLNCLAFNSDITESCSYPEEQPNIGVVSVDASFSFPAYLYLVIQFKPLSFK